MVALIVTDKLLAKNLKFPCKRTIITCFLSKNKQACQEKEQKIKNSRFDLYSKVVFKEEDGKIDKKLKIPESKSQDGKSI